MQIDLKNLILEAEKIGIIGENTKNDILFK